MREKTIKMIILLAFGCFLILPAAAVYAGGGGGGMDPVDIGFDIDWFKNWKDHDRDELKKRFDLNSVRKDQSGNQDVMVEITTEMVNIVPVYDIMFDYSDYLEYIHKNKRLDPMYKLEYRYLDSISARIGVKFLF